MNREALPPVSRIVPGLRGIGVVTATAEVAGEAVPLLREAGYEVVTIDGSRADTRREALTAIAAALDLPGAADHNLDALLDTLRELPDRADRADFARHGVVLLWTRADRIRIRDPKGWQAVRGVLADASGDLRDGGFGFEAVVCEADGTPGEATR